MYAQELYLFVLSTNILQVSATTLGARTATTATDTTTICILPEQSKLHDPASLLSKRCAHLPH